MNRIPVVWLSLTRKRGSRAQASRLNDELSSSRRNLKAFRQQHNLNHSTLTRRLQQRQTSPHSTHSLRAGSGSSCCGSPIPFPSALPAAGGDQHSTRGEVTPVPWRPREPVNSCPLSYRKSLPAVKHGFGLTLTPYRPSSRRTRSQSASRCPSWSVGTRT